MKKATLMLTHPEASREGLLAFAGKVPGAYVGLKIAALLLILEGQRPGWVSEILGMTRQSLNVWMHKVNEERLMSLKPKTRPGRPGHLTAQIRRILEEQLEKSPFGVWAESSLLGRPHLNGTIKEEFWDKVKGAPSPILDAPTGVWAEVGQLLLSSSALGGC